mgnify:CR=1 FL=1
MVAPGADPGIYFGGPNQGPQSKVKGEARIEGAKRPSIEGEARVEGAKRPRIEGEARTEGEAQEKAGRGVWGGGSVSPSPENFWKIKLETIHFGAYLKQLFEMTNEIAHFHEKSLVIIWCDGIIKFCWSIKLDRGSGGRSPPEAKTF